MINHTGKIEILTNDFSFMKLGSQLIVLSVLINHTSIAKNENFIFLSEAQ